jgi:tetratricopeptide (TPR) repeat protein
MASETISRSEAQARFQEAFAAHQRGELPQAEQGYMQALEADPDHPEALHFLGILYHQQGENWQALEYIKRSLKELPNRPQFHYHLGLVLEVLGRDHEALAAFNAALGLESRFPEALNNRCGVYRRLGALEEAEADARQAIELQPDLAVARTHLARILQAKGDPVAALESLDEALAQSRDNPEIWSNKVAVLLDMDRLEEAEAAAREALELHPQSVMLLNQLGHALRILGHPEESIACHREAVRLNPADTTAYYNLASFMAHYDVGVEPIQLEAWYDSHTLPPNERLFLAFGLGDYYAAKKDNDRAFQYWLEGNQQVRRTKPVITANVVARVNAWNEAFSGDVLDGCGDWGHASDVPIFVVGMPRSGTTLVEQILSAHPQVVGAGEAGDLMGLIQQEIQAQEGELDAERWDRYLDPDKAERLGQFYVSQMQRLAGEGPRIVNKTPGNYQYIGLIQTILPGARVICCRRDPLDSGLSIFSKHFSGVDYSYAMEDIGVVYQSFLGAMTHWRDVADPALLTEVQYEDLIADPEAHVAALLDHCDLPWDEACLRFFENPRPVRTASSVQVRQPLYTSAVGRWQRFGNNLLPLARTTGDDQRIPDAASFDAFSRLGRRQLEAGRYRDAAENFRAAMLYEGGRDRLHFLLGQALEARGWNQEALACFRTAHETLAGERELPLGLARTCRKVGRLDEARGWLEGAGEPDSDPAIAVEWGYHHWCNWDWEAAEDAFTTVLAAHPGHEEALLGLVRLYSLQDRWEMANPVLQCLERWHPDSAEVRLVAINTLGRQARFEEAESRTGHLLAEDPGNARAYLLLARTFFLQDRYGEAEAACREALTVEPEFPEAAALRGYLLDRMGQPEEARGVCRHALVIGGESGEVWYQYARTLFAQGDFEGALERARRSEAVEPWNLAARGLEIATLERLNRLDEVEGLLEPLQQAFPRARNLHFWGARLNRRKGRLEAAKAWLAPVVASGGEISPMYWGEMGHIHNRLGEADEAYACFRRANELQAQRPEFLRAPKEQFLRYVATLDEAFTREQIDAWAAPPVASGWQQPPVFLVGFVRSGTTLLHQIIESHPDVQVLEEQATIQPLLRHLRDRHGGIVDGLRQATDEDLRELQGIYLETRDELLGQATGGERLVVDKMPLRTVEAGLLYRIFPDARFLFARRHPCDCILSSFMQLFDANPAMANFHTLADAAHLYTRVMTLWDRYQDLLAPVSHEVRYEDLVANFDEVVAGVLAFLGLDWTDAVRDFRANALARGAVRTASYAQVSEGLYQRAVGRWEGYRHYFEPFLPELAPWIRPKGYQD